MPPGPSSGVEGAAAEAAARRSAFVTTFDAARDAAASSARSTPKGAAVALKDNIAVAGAPCSAGSRALRDWRPATDAEVTRRLRAAGARIAGTTRMHELAMGWTGQSAAFGDTCHPEDPARMAGGSSGGSACAVASGLVDLALGTDTNGSIRIPAAFCGIAGLRPSHGRHPMGGVMPLAPSMDTVGPMARRVETLALLDATLASGPVVALQPTPVGRLRLGVCRAFHWDRLDADVAAACEIALRALEAAGAAIVPVELPGWSELTEGVARAVIAYESRTCLPAFLAAQAGAPAWPTVAAQVGDDLHPALAAWEQPGLDAAYRDAMQRRAALRTAWATAVRTHRLDAMVYPAVRVIAPLRTHPPVSPGPDVQVDGQVLPARLAFAHNLAPASLGGWPSLVLPVGRGRVSGLPAALAFDGPAGGDQALLSLGAAVQALIDADGRQP